MTCIPTFNSKNGTKLLTVLPPWLWPQRSCLRLGPSAGPSLTHGRCWKSLNWRRAARVPHAISRTPGFLPPWAWLGRCSHSSCCCHAALPPDHSPARLRKKPGQLALQLWSSWPVPGLAPSIIPSVNMGQRILLPGANGLA